MLALVAKHTYLVHARVGHAEGPQVSDPAAPEFAPELDAHFSWWRAIWASQRARKFETFWAEPEFGPAPYQQCLPYTQQPTTDLWQVNGYVAGLIAKEFAK